MKYPVGIQTFEQIIQDGYVYADKTDLIYKLVKGGKIYFLGRPRRFGKSLLVSTIKNYFLGRKELFKGLAIEKLENEWAQHPVFHVDFNSTDFTVPGNLENLIDQMVKEWEGTYGKSDIYTDIGRRFAYVLHRAHLKYQRRAVVLIDEYDKPLLDVFDSGTIVEVSGRQRLLEDRHREILKAFYSTFKAADADLQFVLLTGVTKFSQVSVFSGFNQAEDISMVPEYDALCGITDEEIDHYFSHSIQELADQLEMTKEEARQALQMQYDGYHFSEGMTAIYNPFSLLNSLKHKTLRDYWFASGTPTYLVRLLAHYDESINEITGKYYDPSEFVDYKADIEKPLPMIYQSGYLTIKGYKRDMGTFLLDFPNNEVKKGFATVLANNYIDPRLKTGGFARDLSEAMRDGSPDRMRDLFVAFFAETPYALRHKNDEKENERYFQRTMYLIFRIVSVYTTYAEKMTCRGRIDCVVETPGYVYIFEFKLDGSAREALQQIEEKGYADPYAADGRRVFKIGVNFSSQTGNIEEWETA